MKAIIKQIKDSNFVMVKREGERFYVGTSYWILKTSPLVYTQLYEKCIRLPSGLFMADGEYFESRHKKMRCEKRDGGFDLKRIVDTEMSVSVNKTPLKLETSYEGDCRILKSDAGTHYLIREPFYQMSRELELLHIKTVSKDSANNLIAFTGKDDSILVVLPVRMHHELVDWIKNI